MAELPNFTTFRVPQDLKSEQQLRIGFERLLKLQDEQVVAIGILNNEVEALGGGPSVSGDAPINVADGVVSISVGNGLSVDDNSLVVSLASPLAFSGGQVGLNLGNGLQVDTGQLRVNVGAGLAFNSGAVELSNTNLTTATPSTFEVLAFNDSNVPLTIAQDALLGLISTPIDIFDNGFVYSNLPLNNIPGTMTAAQWNNTTRPELEAIFLQIIAYLNSLQATINSNNSNMVASPLFEYG